MISLLPVSALCVPYPNREKKRIAWYEGLTYKQVHVDFDDPATVASETARIRGLCTKPTDVITISRESITEAHCKHYRYTETPQDYPSAAVTLDPYFLGIWLGDGTAHTTQITTMDPPIVAYIHAYAESMGLQVTVQTKSSKANSYTIIGHKNNKVLQMLDALDLRQNKHIPPSYQRNSKDVRLQVLAGLIDTDGYMQSTTKYEIVQKGTQLSNDIVTLARSLGFHTTIDETTKSCPSASHEDGVFTGQYWRIHISIDQLSPAIPVKLERKRFDASKVKQWDNPKIDMQGNPLKRASGLGGTRWTKEMEDELVRRADAQIGARKKWPAIDGPLFDGVSSDAKRRKYRELVSARG